MTQLVLESQAKCPKCGSQRVHRKKPFRGWFCKKCSNAFRREWYRSGGQAAIMLASAKQRAIKQGLPFNLEAQDIIIPENCPVLGIPLEQGTRKNHWSAPSLDRIRPELGYVKGNVIVVSWRANFLRSNGTLEELEKVVAYSKSITNLQVRCDPASGRSRYVAALPPHPGGNGRGLDESSTTLSS